LATVLPLRLLLKVKEENTKGFARLQFLLDAQTIYGSSSTFEAEDNVNAKRLDIMISALDLIK